MKTLSSSLMLFAAIVTPLALRAAVMSEPTSVYRTEKGWAVAYVLPKAELVDYVDIACAGGTDARWSGWCDNWRMLAGDGIKDRLASYLPHEHSLRVLTIELESETCPTFGRAEFKRMPDAPGAIDETRVRRIQEDPCTVYVNLGRAYALTGVSYPAELGKLDVFGSWEPGFVAKKVADLGFPFFGKTSVIEGRTVNVFHHIERNSNQLKIVADRPIDASKLVVEVVPYGFRKHLTDETWEQKLQRLAWWQEARFGMFIHFGLYALPARHEWFKTKERIGEEHYQLYFDHFNPDRFDAKKWAKAAKDAGMKYVVLTSKHHEGFCLWDSQVTDYKITNTPFKRDLIKEYVEAFRAEGIKVGFYYSLIDWHHPDFTVDMVHPRRDGNMWDKKSGMGEKVAALNRGRDMARYRQYMKDQVTELLTNYGKIDIIWFDFSYPQVGGKGCDDWDSEGLLKLAKRLQPQIIIDNRLDLPDYEDGWDFLTPEQNREETVPTFAGRAMPWETCQTFSGSWGYYRDEKTWKSDYQCIEQLIDTVSKGGNVIMNVGPTARGEFDDRALSRLAGYGKWLAANGRSIYGCGPAPAEFVAPEGTKLTYNAKTNRLYIHVLSWQYGSINVTFGRRIKLAKLLSDDSEILYANGALHIPVDKPNDEIPVIEVILK